MTPTRQPEGNLEELFEEWYNAGGQRKTLAQVAADHGIGYSTVRRYADLGDWDVRAQQLDDEIARERDRALAGRLARSRVRNVETVMTVIGRFMVRLDPYERDEAGNIRQGESGPRPNPHYLQPGEITIRDLDTMLKAHELLTGNPTFRVQVGAGGDGAEDDLEAALLEMQERIVRAELSSAERPGLPAGVPATIEGKKVPSGSTTA